MEVYVVGGAPRDILLGRLPSDLDYVVVGSSHDEMITNGFIQVGSGFPVYLHPKTGDEYALARTETKVGVGYTGFECDTTGVSLVEDLSRRDTTINSIAVRVEDWETFQATVDTDLCIDPFGGILDLSIGILKHINSCFGLDVVRVLRTARFAARYGFTVHPETMDLMSTIVHELDNVPAERIWLEFAKGLMEPHASNMITALSTVGAFRVNSMKPYVGSESIPQLYFDRIKTLTARFAIIGSNFTKTDYEGCRVPNECANMSLALNNFGEILSNYNLLLSTARLNLLIELRAMTRIEFIKELMLVVIIKYNTPFVVIHAVFRDIQAINSLDQAAIANTCINSNEIKHKIYDARLAVINTY